MKKEIYDKAELELIRIRTSDVLVESLPGSDDDDELPFVPAKN